jgi:hypothetical protein
MVRTASEGGFTTRSRDKERTLTTADRSLRMHGLLRRIRPHLLNHPRYHLLTRTSKRQVLIEKFAHTLQVLRFIKKIFQPDNGNSLYLHHIPAVVPSFSL